MSYSSAAALIATRICHDLASPIGAIANTADLIREFGPDPASDDIGSVWRTADHASRLLQFYRLVFGRASPEDTGIDIERFSKLAVCQEVSGRVGLTISKPAAASMTRPSARIAGLMLMVGRAMLGLRGELQLILPGDDDTLPRIAAKGDRVALSDEMRTLLTDANVEDKNPSLIEFSMLRDALKAHGAAMTITEGDHHIVIGASNAAGVQSGAERGESVSR